MFLYTSLFIASLIAALVLYWLYNAIVEGGRAVKQGVHSSKHTDEPEREIMPTAAADVPSVREQGEHSNPSQTAPTTRIARSDTVPWGWPSSDHGQGESARQHNLSGQKDALTAGWPSRVDKPELTGKAYKVSRKKVTRGNKSLRSTDKPWGW